MNSKPKINPSLKNAIAFALAYQIPLLLMALFVGCGNSNIGLISSFASISFWAGIIIIIYRRRLNPTKFDLFIVRVAYLPSMRYFNVFNVIGYGDLSFFSKAPSRTPHN